MSACPRHSRRVSHSAPSSCGWRGEESTSSPPSAGTRPRCTPAGGCCSFLPGNPGVRRRDDRQAGRGGEGAFSTKTYSTVDPNATETLRAKGIRGRFEYNINQPMEYFHSSSVRGYNEYQRRFSSPWLPRRGSATSVLQPCQRGRVSWLARLYACVILKRGTAAALLPTLRTLVSLLCRYGTCPAFLLLRATTHCSR